MTVTANFDTRFVIWGMDQSLTLDTLPDLLSMDYKVPIEYLIDRQLDTYEKTLMNVWRATNGEKFKIESIEIGGSEIRYIAATGLYESPLSSTRAIVDGRLLPRDYRVFNRTVNAVFFELHGRVYSVLEAGISQEGRVRSILFGQGYKHKKEEWGKVNYKDLPQYKLDSRFFYWIFSKRGQKLNISLDGDTTFSINVLDVSAVSQLSEKNVHDNRNEGPDVLGSIPALSGLGINQNVYEGGFHLVVNDIQLFSRFTENCTCALDSARSLISLNEKAVPVITEFPQLVVTLYTLLLPGLLATFHRESENGNWTITQESEQRRTWALQVIKELSYDNNISLEDIEIFLEDTSAIENFV